jgi:hypothetical protein
MPASHLMSHFANSLLRLLHFRFSAVSLRSGKKMKDFGGETPYSVMFGPDICGYSTRKTHVIFTYDGKNHLVKKDIKAETDQLTHVYTLRLMPNNTYEVRASKRCCTSRGEGEGGQQQG